MPTNGVPVAVAPRHHRQWITNSDLKLAGLVLLWLMMEHICGPLAEKHIALFSNNNPTVSWVQQMACCSSLVAEQLIRVLAL